MSADSKLRTFGGLILLLCLAYFLFELGYISYAKFSLDDFWLSYHTYQYKLALPYRDFSPYKTVLGYYFYLPPLILFDGVISPIIYTKLWIVLINVFFLAVAAKWLKIFFSPRAVITTLMLIISMQIFLCFSVDVRVDLLAYWFCLFSILFLFEEKYVWAGLSIGLGFIICQKAIWYFIATNCGLFCQWFVEKRNWKTVKEIFLFNYYALLIVGTYIVFWSFLADLKTVLHSVFYEPYIISTVTWYDAYSYYLWRIVIDNNPALVLLWPIAYLGLFIMPIKNRLFILVYSTVILFFIIHCRHPFAYYFLSAIPILFIVYSAFFTEIYKGFKPNNKSKKLIVVVAILYLLSLLFLSLRFALPNSYLIVVLIPISLAISYSIDLNRQWQCFFNKLIKFSFLLTGIIFPLLQLGSSLPGMSGRYQKSMVHLMNDLLASGETYIAGAPFLFHIKQSVPGLVHIVGPSLTYLEHPTKELARVMQLDSLYFSPATTQQLISMIKKKPVKFYVDNNRFHFLPSSIHDYLAGQYQHFWGSIFLYAPTIEAGQQKISLKFTGLYKVEAAKDALIVLNKQKLVANKIIVLRAKQYDSHSNQGYRLKLMPPPLKTSLEPQFKANAWQEVLNWN